jgi:tetratricopeptide (TPR) repeat protein
LSSATTPAEEALREFLNGNYPELAALVPKINAPVLRAMAFLELKHVGYAYSKTNAGGNIALDLPTVQWSTVFKSAARDMDAWYAPDNVQFFGSIQGLFPQFDGDFRERLKGQVASGTYDTSGLNISLLESIFNHAFSKGGNGCCAHYGNELEPTDIWSLYRNIAVANLLRKLDRATNIYGSYRTATDLAEQLQPWLTGNTSFMALYADSLYHYAKEVTGDERAFVLQKVRDMAADIILYSDEVDANSYLGEWLSYQLPHSKKTYNSIKSCETWRCDFPSSMVTHAITGRSDALPYDNLKFSLLAKAAATKQLDEAIVKEQLETRFNGAPEKTPFLADRLIKSEQREQAISLLQQTIATNEASWNAYKRLGDLLIAKGEYAEASETFMKFHDFTKPEGKDRVLTSNRAYDAGRELYWRGRFKEAQPLFEVAAGLDTGAGSQYTAIKYLAIAGGDFSTVAKVGYRQGRRYNSAGGFRDYLTVMHLVGAHDQAQAAFLELAPRFNTPFLWASAFVGQRIENKTFENVVTWTNTYLSTIDDANQKRQAADYLTRQAATDRRASMTQVSAIADLETPSNMPPPGMRGRLEIKLGLNPVRPCVDPQTECDSQSEVGYTYMNYDYAGFLYAYALLQQGKFEASVNAFLEYDRLHPMLDYNIPHSALPYFAIAASESHNQEALAKLLPLLKKQEEDDSFYHNLTRAVIEANLGHLRESLEALVMAQRHCLMDDGWHPVNNWYELLQVAEWLHKKTGDGQFMDKAVTWAKEYTVIQPQDGWAYAFEARYSKKSSDRIRAAAFAEYLDPSSAWLSSVPKEIRSRAHSWWPKHNPFKFKAETSMLKL